MQYAVYVLKSEKTGRYYVGCTKDLDLRLQQHNKGMTKSTKGFGPWQVIHVERYENLSEARQRETKIKSWKSRYHMEKALGLKS